MKKLKILVALFSGLLAFTSVKAGEMTVTGTMQATYSQATDGVTGNPLGLNTDLAFEGTTEVLSATAVTWKMATDGTFAGDTGADHTLKFSNDYGTFKIGNAGDSANAVDDITPTAFEEANGSGSGTYGVDFGSGMEGSMSVGYALGNIMGTGVSVDYTYYPRLDGTLNNEKATSGDTTPDSNSAQSINVVIDPSNYVPALDGLKVTGGYEKSSSLYTNLQNKEGGTVAVNYVWNALSLGYQQKGYHALTTTIATDDVYYRDTILGAAYAINDSLAISYNKYESKKGDNTNGGMLQETSAVNVAYTIGGLTIGFQEASTDNANYVLNATDDTRTISLKTAF